MVYRLIDEDPPGGAIDRVTFVAFLPGGVCAALPGPELISGAVARGESVLLDASVRIPLEAAGYFRQRVRAFALDGAEVYAWLDGDRYTGRRPHATVDLVVTEPDQLADALDGRGLPQQARAVRDAATIFRALGEGDYYADTLRLLEPAYLRAGTPEGGSGFGGTAEDWRACREMIVDGIDRDGTFLDLGCANGLLMESVHRWAAERGRHVEPYGVDLGSGLVAAARARLPRWADRITVGNAMTYALAGGRRFTFVHVIVDLVPVDLLGDLLRHALEVLVEPGGRLLVSRYTPAGSTDGTDVGDLVRSLGFPVAGVSRGGTASEASATAGVPR